MYNIFNRKYLNRKERVSINIKGQGYESCFWSICDLSSTVTGNSYSSSTSLFRTLVSNSIIFILQIRNMKPTEVMVSFI